VRYGSIEDAVAAVSLRARPVGHRLRRQRRRRRRTGRAAPASCACRPPRSWPR
jgi:hypothetical protein